MLKRVLILSIFFIATTAFGAKYQLQDFGLWEMGDSKPISINTAGDVVGHVQVGGVQKVFYWNKKVGTKILTQIPDGAYVTKLNNNGQVVGHFYAWDGWWTPKWVLHAFLWSEKEGLKNIGSIDSKDTRVAGINDQGQVILHTSENQCYIWENGKTSKIEEAAHVIYQPEDDLVCARLNNQEFVFVRRDPSERKNAACILRFDLKTGVSHYVDCFKRGIAFLSCINSKGAIAGFFTQQKKPEAFLASKDDKLTTTWKNFQPRDMNDANKIVGTMYVGCLEKGGVSFEGNLYDVNDLMLPKDQQPFAYQEITSLEGINNDEIMIGVANCWNSHQAVLLLPRK